MIGHAPFLGQVRISPDAFTAQTFVPTPVDQLPPGTSPLSPPSKFGILDGVMAVGVVAAIGAAAYALFK